MWDSGADASTGGTCEPPELKREPGPPVYDLSAKGKGTCADSALGTVIDAVHALHPELDDIVELYVPDPNRGGDQSYIYAFETTLDGGFALVFRRGAGDCPAGCTENDYYYFRTGEDCEPRDFGSYVPRYASGCVEVEGFPLWDHPPPPAPSSVCGLEPRAYRLGEEYSEYACGQLTPCSGKGGDAPVEMLDLELQFTIAQDESDLGHVMLTLLNTGHPALDGRAWPAVVEDQRRVHVVDQGDNLPATCLEMHELEIVLDLEGYSGSFVHYFEVKTPDCAGNPGDICKGGLDLDLGNLGYRACRADNDLMALVRREQSKHGDCEVDADCALVAWNECIGECPNAIRADYVDTMQALLDLAGEAYCENGNCFLDSDCSLYEATCREGRCVP